MTVLFRMFQMSNTVNLIICAALLSFTGAENQARAEIYNLNQFDDGLYRGARPSLDEDYERLKSLGIKTILSLQTKSEEGTLGKEQAERYGFAYIHLPISPISPYVSRRKIASVIEVLNDDRNKPVYVHCKYGHDRTGLSVGMYRIHIQNWQPKAAFEEMMALGFKPYLVWGLSLFFNGHKKPDSLLGP